MPFADSFRLIPRPWLVVILLWFVVCSNYLARVMIATMHGSIMQAIPMTEAQFGLLMSTFLWVYGLASPFAGFVADRFSRRRVIIISMFMWSATTWLTSFATTFPQLIAMRVLMGLSEACYIPAGLALIADYHHGHSRSLSRAIGLHQTGMVAGAILAGVAGWVAELNSWDYAFRAVGLLGIAYCVPLLFLLRDAPRPETAGAAELPAAPKLRFLDAISDLARNWSFLGLLCVVAVSAGATWVLGGWLPTYMMEHFNLKQGVAGLSALGYMNAAAAVGLVVGGYWSDRWARTNLRARAYVPALGFMIAIPALMIVVTTQQLPVAIGFLIIFGVTEAFLSSNQMPILCQMADARYRATGYGIINAVGCITAGVTVYAAGALRDAHYELRDIFFFAASSQILCIVILLRMRFKAPAPTPGTSD